ncbi:MAG TPA: glycosyltransferase family 4 protein [Gemmataceae bacterium]|nr:glycosyltransferase family 4 protein [Gemmataceae bacterium]
MRRVLHLNDYPGGTFGGAEVLMVRTVGLLRAAGWDARTFTQADLPDPRLTAVRYLDNRVARRSLRRVLADFAPDIVHLHNYYHVLSPAILGELDRYKQRTSARVVMYAHDFHLVCPNSGATWFRRGELNLADFDRARSWAYLLGRRWDHRGWAYSVLKLVQHLWHYRVSGDRRRVIDLVLCPSRFMQNAIARARRPTAHLPYPNPPFESRRADRPAELTLIFAGRIEPEKGLVQLLEMLPANFGGRFRVVGDGVDRAAAEEICRRRGLSDRVEFLGRRPHAETMTLIAGAHVLVLPSRWFENYPLSMLEALAAGTNLLVADCGGMREIVEDAGAGYRFAPNDAESVAEQLGKIAAAHKAGTLNSFDVTNFLTSRNEAAYVDRLLRIYAGEPA